MSRETAADAVMDVVATLDALRQGVELPPNRIEHTLAMLMLISALHRPARRLPRVSARGATSPWVVRAYCRLSGSQG